MELTLGGVDGDERHGEGLIRLVLKSHRHNLSICHVNCQTWPRCALLTGLSPLPHLALYALLKISLQAPLLFLHTLQLKINEVYSLP